MVATRRSKRTKGAVDATDAAASAQSTGEPSASDTSIATSGVNDTPRKSARKRRNTFKAQNNAETKAEATPKKDARVKAALKKNARVNPTQDAEEKTKTKSPVIPSEDSMLVKPVGNDSAEKTVGFTDSSNQHTLADAKDNDADSGVEEKLLSHAAAGLVTKRRKPKYRRQGSPLKISWSENETRTYDVEKPPNSTPCADELNDNLRSTKAEAVRNGNQNNTPTVIEENNVDKPVDKQTDDDKVAKATRGDKAASMCAQKEEVGSPPEPVKYEDADSPTTAKVKSLDLKKSRARNYDSESDSDSSTEPSTTKKVNSPKRKKLKAPQDGDSDSDSSLELSTKHPNVARKPEAKTNPSCDSKDSIDRKLPRDVHKKPATAAAAAAVEYDSDSSSMETLRKPAPTKQNPSAKVGGNGVMSSLATLRTVCEPPHVDDKTHDGRSPRVIDADESTDRSESPLVTFPFDGLVVADLKRVESLVTPKSLTVALVTRKTHRHLDKLRKAPFWSKDKRRLRWSDALADNLYCFVRNW